MAVSFSSYEKIKSEQADRFNLITLIKVKGLEIPLDNLDFKYAHIGKRIPVVLSREETHKLIIKVD